MARRTACRSLSLALLALAALARPALALSGLGLPWPEKLADDRRDWTLHPLGDDVDGLRLTTLLSTGALDLDAAMQRALRAFTALPLALKSLHEVPSALSLTIGTKSALYQMQFAGLPVCGMFVRAHQLEGGSLAVFGAAPGADSVTPTAAADWPSLEAATAAARAAVVEHGADEADPFSVSQQARCYAAHDHGLVPAWRLTVAMGGLGYDVTAADGRAYAVDERFLPVTGSARIYAQDPRDALSDVALKDLVGDGTITGTFLAVKVPDGFKVAKNDKNVFNYDPKDQLFVQPSVYAHVQAQLEFFKTLGYEWPTGKVLEIRPHLNEDKSVGFDNAFYKFPDSSEPGLSGTIKLGDGGGVQLQNLGTDGDVTAHEFGHQVIFGYLKTATRCTESFALHEGLADFFAFSRTGDPCLGETICVPGFGPEVGGCIIESKCLRTALVAAQYGDEDWKGWFLPKDATCLKHNHGQLFSGLLWDMRTPEQFSGADLSRLAYRAVQLFKPDSGFRDFLLALFLADKELFKDKHRAMLLKAIKERNLTGFVQDVGDAGDTPPLTGLGSQDALGTGSAAAAKAGAAKAEKGKDTKKKGLCGVAGAGPGADGAVLLLLLLGGLAPLGLKVCR